MDQIANWLDRHDVNLVLVLITLGIVINISDIARTYLEAWAATPPRR